MTMYRGFPKGNGKISIVDLVTIKVKYHTACMVEYRNCYNSHEKQKNKKKIENPIESAEKQRPIQSLR